ncbi:hypothetical protein [Streptomyces sp. NPDC093109]|uniref:hypothetical protein n=1 Tax=Streptomyces sp. NPDC093109 TaxID=3154977 RepID=UPI0034508F6A
MDSRSVEATVQAITKIRDRLDPADPASRALASAIEAARNGDPEFAIDDVSNALHYFKISLQRDDFQALHSAAVEFSMEDCLEWLHVT